MQYKHQGDIFGRITKAENKQQKKKKLVPSVRLAVFIGMTGSRVDPNIACSLWGPVHIIFAVRERHHIVNELK